MKVLFVRHAMSSNDDLRGLLCQALQEIAMLRGDVVTLRGELLTMRGEMVRFRGAFDEPTNGNKTVEKDAVLSPPKKNIQSKPIGITKFKRPPSSFIMWLNAVYRPKYVAEFPDAKQNELTATAGIEWNKMSDTKKSRGIKNIKKL